MPLLLQPITGVVGVAGSSREPAPRGENWRATFFVTGMAHSIGKGSAYEPTPWRAVQRAAWEAANAI